VIVAPCTSALASCDLIVTDCLSPRFTKFKLAANVGPGAGDLAGHGTRSIAGRLAPGACDGAGSVRRAAAQVEIIALARAMDIELKSERNTSANP